MVGRRLRRALALFNGNLLRAGGNCKIASTLIALQLEDAEPRKLSAGETALMIRHLMVPITAAMVTIARRVVPMRRVSPRRCPGQAPTSSAFPPVNGSAPVASVGGAPQSSFPVNGGRTSRWRRRLQRGLRRRKAGPGEDCMKAFMPLREDAEKRGKLIKAASDRHAPPDEACKLIRNFSQAETKMIKYIEANASKCGISAQIGAQMKDGHKNTEAMAAKVCNVAQQMQNQPRGLGRSVAKRSAGSGLGARGEMRGKKGGSTFDTLNGNVPDLDERHIPPELPIPPATGSIRAHRNGSRPYLRLSRFDRPIGSWLLLMPCWRSAALAAGHGA